MHTLCKPSFSPFPIFFPQSQDGVVKDRPYAACRQQHHEHRVQHRQQRISLQYRRYRSTHHILRPDQVHIDRGELADHSGGHGGPNEPHGGHAHRADDIFTAVRIAEEFGLDYCVVHCTQGHLIADRLAKAGVKAFSGPLISDRCKPELKDSTPATPGVMSKAGVKTAIVTDHPVIPIQYLPLCAGLAVREGMEHDEALRAITINPAEMCGIADRVGSLEAGKDADLVITDGSPFEVSTTVRRVLIGGKTVHAV